MKKFAQFILENIGSKTKKHDDIVTEMNLDDLYRVDEPQGNKEHKIVTAIKNLKMVGGNADLVFKIKHGDTTHTITIPPVEGNDARGRTDFTHVTEEELPEVAGTDEVPAQRRRVISKDMIELKLRSTPKIAIAKQGKFRELLDKLLSGHIAPSSTTRRKLTEVGAIRFLARIAKNMRENMPRENDGDRRYLGISKVIDHRLLHPDQNINRSILSEIQTLPNNKQKLLRQALRLMHERLTGIEKQKSEFHLTDLDDRKEVRKTGSHLYSRVTFMPKSGYISVKTGNQNDHAIIRVDPQHEHQLQDQLENDLPLEDDHPLHNHYVNKIKTTGQHKTTIMPSHEEALVTINRIGSGVDKFEVPTRTTFS